MGAQAPQRPDGNPGLATNMPSEEHPIHYQRTVPLGTSLHLVADLGRTILSLLRWIQSTEDSIPHQWIPMDTSGGLGQFRIQLLDSIKWASHV